MHSSSMSLLASFTYLRRQGAQIRWLATRLILRRALAAGWGYSQPRRLKKPTIDSMIRIIAPTIT